MSHSGYSLTWSNVIFLTGLLHFCQIPAMLFAPVMLGWKEDLAKLSPINRAICCVMGGGIILTVLGLGVVVAVACDDIAGGNAAGIGLASFLAIFWAYRASIQIFLYSRIWPSGPIGRLSHYGLVALFTFQAGIYSFAATGPTIWRID